MSKRGTQRTRGNLKPTSSARASASVLTPGVSPFAIFSGGETLQSNGFDENGIDNEIDSDLRVILRKLTKKDSTTKKRAFGELRDYCDSNESDDKIRGILPFFALHYRKWSTDSDQQVRVECQLTFDTIGTRMKKNLAPHLKALLPIWLMSQCDSYAPAASKAKALYEKLFPGDNRRAEVVYFARNEILTTLTDEINQCSDVLKDRKENEMETDDAHERRLTQVLLALALFLSYFDENKRSELTSQFKNIFDSGKFWKLDKIKSIQIQSSFYRCLYKLINLIPDVIKEYQTKIIPSVFYAINETDPKLCPLIWDCFILCLETFDDCWSMINFQKAFLPKLYAFLRSACHGNVFGAKDCLVPLLEKLPTNIFNDENLKFIENFFQSMEDGILSIKGRQQMNNVNSLLKCYMDCLIYILETHIDNQFDFLNERLLPLLRLSLLDKDCSIRDVYARQYIYLLTSIKSFQLYSKHLDRVLSLFEDLIQQNLSINESKFLFEQSTLLFKTLLGPQKLKSLRFATSSSSTDLSSIDSTTFQSDDIDDESNAKDTYLIDFQTKLIDLCYRYCLDHSNDASFEYGLELFIRLVDFSIESTIELMLKKLISNSNQTNTLAELFYSNYSRALIKIAIEKRYSLDHIVKLTIQILNSLNSSDEIVERVLADLIQLDSSRRFYFLLASIVCQYESLPSFRKWLQTHGVLEQLLNMTASVTKSNESNDMNFPVSTEEFQLLSSLLYSSTNSKQFLNSTQEEQVVFLACRLFDEQISSLNDLELHDDLMQSIDHVAEYLFDKIDQTYSTSKSTKRLFQLYLQNDFNNTLKKNFQLSEHQRAIWLRALKQSKKVEQDLIEQILEHIFSLITNQLENEHFIDTILSICQEQNRLTEKFHSKLLKRITLTDEFIYESWIYGMLHGWIVPDQTMEIRILNKKFSENERLNDVQFACSLIFRQYELNSYLWRNDSLIKQLILNYYLFQYRLIECQTFYRQLERLFNLPVFHLDIQLIEQTYNSKEFFGELIYYHFYSKIRDHYLHLNQRDEYLHYTFLLNQNDQLNCHLILASSFREAQLKTLVDYLIEQCQDERRSELTLATLDHLLKLINRLGVILDENVLNKILEILVKLNLSSKENLELIQLWNTVLNHGQIINTLKHDYWDKVLCLISNLFTNLTNVQEQINKQFSLRTEFLFIYSSNLLTTIGKHFSNDSISKDLADEWLILHSKAIYSGLFPLYIALPSALKEFSSFLVTNEMIKSICSAICTIPTEYLIENNLKPLFHSEDNQLNLSESIQTVFNHLYRLLSQTPHRSIQYSAYHLLVKLLPSVAQSLIQSTIDSNEITEDEHICRLPGSMIESLARTEHTIGSMLTENDFVDEHLLNDDEHEILTTQTPNFVQTDKDYVLISELLNYRLILNLINCYLSMEDKYTYTLMLQEKKLVDRFLTIVLGLIPANPVFIDPLSMQVSSITKKLTHSKSMFENEIQLNPNGELNSPNSVPHLACSVYFQCLSLIPALVREWYSNQTKHIRDAIDRLTQKYVSPVLIQQQLDSASSLKDIHIGESGLFNIKKHLNTREITAIYNIESSRVEICIKLPENYPLSNTTIECTHHIGFTKEQWNKWMLQLKTNLTQNNGAIADGLLHWKKNIDKMMQGIEECSICYCILHTNNELPKRTCRTCKKKFHDACLFRWFRSSNKSTCPHCRANF